jgi:hypothetical protein
MTDSLTHVNQTARHCGHALLAAVMEYSSPRFGDSREPDHWHGLLRTRRDGPHCRSAKQRDEWAPLFLSRLPPLR